MPYTINRTAVTKLLYGKTPYPDMVPIFPELNRRAEAVAHRAKVLVPKRTGATAASIHNSSRLVAPFWWFKIEADTPYAWYLHHGTKPHIERGGMTFRSGSRIVHARVVHHPGTRPRPYLKDALPDFWRAHESGAFISADAATVSYMKAL